MRDARLVELRERLTMHWFTRAAEGVWQGTTELGKLHGRMV